MITESQIEQNLIERLVDLKYTYRAEIADKDALHANFRQKFEELNRVRLSDSEFARLIEEIVTPDVFGASTTLRQVNTLIREDGTPLNYQLVNLKDWCKNTFEVVNQVRINTDNSHHRYDVLLLLNGIPVVQIELKALKISPRTAMQQIVDYKSDPGNGYGHSLLCFIQLFIVSNQTETRYFANNNSQHFAFNADERFLPVCEFATPNNKKVNGIFHFSEAFLAKCILAEMVSRYMVLVASEQKLMMMRPYQIYAVQAIVECIHQNRGNGYIWHTTGSGKTLTSFKTSTLLKDNPDVEKVLFVVDRKDLDRQTREEFNRFQDGCVEENTNTETLVRRLLSDDYANKVIVTTIQKLGLALDPTNRRNYQERLKPLAQKRMVFIFDECHRSQFGENHQAIKDFFPRAQMFGFTGTPIFPKNATQVQITGQEKTLRTTEDLFEKQLHAYTITHAIEDRNVLRFHIDYYRPEGEAVPKAGEGPAHRAVVQSILEKHDAATADRKFNAILATQSINQAIEYWRLFQELQAEKEASDLHWMPLNVACVFSPPAEGNADVAQIQEDLPNEARDNQEDPDGKKAALRNILDDYNARYGTNHKLGEFDLYYQDVQKRIKDHQFPNRDYPASQKIDVMIVVDMLLTGFDSKYLNTLYVDKNLKYHGLIQALSRTNRVLNDTKPAGNILDFRAQQERVDEAIALFSGEQTEKAKKIWLVDPAPEIIDQLAQAKEALDTFLASQGLEPRPDQVPNLQGDQARGQFVALFKEVQRLKTQLDQYTDLTPAQKGEIETVISDDDHWSFRSAYLETAHRLKESKARDEETGDQLDFEFVLFASAVIDYDYIMKLITGYAQEPAEQRTLTRGQLATLIGADAQFVDDKEDLFAYIDSLPLGTGLDEKAIRQGYETFKISKWDRGLADLAVEFGLAPDTLKAFVEPILARRIFDGEALGDLFAPLDLSWKVRTQKELGLMTRLAPQLRRRVGNREISGLAAYE